MRVTVFLDEEAAERLEALADQEHRTVRQQATVLILNALSGVDRRAEPRRETVAA
jgi:predicted transcriptional regulator